MRCSYSTRSSDGKSHRLEDKSVQLWDSLNNWVKSSEIDTALSVQLLGHTHSNLSDTQVLLASYNGELF